ncbi:MAG: hypothetical protein WBO10_07185 [Pyrinomonadaceae bacterium]
MKPKKEKKPARKLRSKTVPAKRATDDIGVHLINPDDLEKHFGPDGQPDTSPPAEVSKASDKKSS